MEGLDIFVSWQAMVVATIVSVSMEGIKRILDLVWKGRKSAKWYCDIVMPLQAGLLGFFSGALIPLRPEGLVEYVAENAAGSEFLAFGVWGILVGAVGGEYLYRRLKNLFTKKRADE